MTLLSVILCAHNPRPDYLRRTLDALKMQTLPKEQWEFLLVDNASREPLADAWDLSWHPQARHLREEALGLAPARLCGISQSRGGLLVFVDDDNVLSPEYLAELNRIGIDHPFLGAWGGSSVGEFEEPPAEWTRTYWPILAVRTVEREIWSNDPNHWQSHPFGAGLCMRREVVEQYVADCKAKPAKMLLGRRGKTLISCEDADMVRTSCKVGLGFGIFPKPVFTHLISRGRLTEEYLVELYRSLTYSGEVLRFSNGDRSGVKSSALDYFLKLIYSLRFRRRERRFYLARCQAHRAFEKWVETDGSKFL